VLNLGFKSSESESTILTVE